MRRLAGNGSTPTPAAPTWANHDALDTLDQLIGKWAAQGRLASETAAEVRALIAQERQARQQPRRSRQRRHGGEPAAAPAPAIQLPERAALPEATPAVMPRPAPATAMVEAAAVTPREPWGERMGRALLSLRTRQTLLFLGAFLLVVSALVLVVFNWASFPPILQFALLAGVCGGLWAGGTWLARQSGLERAGAGLQAVGAVLVPVVAFSLSRPGLLDLEPRGAWLLASALSLPIYALAAWRMRHPLFAVAGCLSGASAVLAALSGVESQWLPLALVVTLLGYLLLARWLQRAAPELAAGPYWVAHAGLPAALLFAALLWTNGDIGAAALAATALGRHGVLRAGGLAGAAAGWAWAARCWHPPRCSSALARPSAGISMAAAGAAMLLAGYLPLARWLRLLSQAGKVPWFVAHTALRRCSAQPC